MIEFITQQLDYIYFLCGLAYCLLVYAAFSIKASRGSTMPWHYMSYFALLQCISSWIGILSLQNWSIWIQPLQEILSCLALVSLFEFARKVSNLDKHYWKGLWIYLLLVAPAFTVAFFDYRYVFTALKALLAAGVLMVGIPCLLTTPRARELHLSSASLAGCILLGLLLILIPLTSFLLPSIPFYHVGKLNVVWLELLLFAQTVTVTLLAVIGRLIYDALREQDLGLDTAMPSHKIGIVLAIIAMAGFFITAGLTTVWEKELKEEFITQTRIAALGVNPARIINLTGTQADLDTADFQRLYEQQMLINRANTSNRWTYLLIMRNERLIILTDSEPTSSPQHTSLVEYNDAPPAILPVFSSGHPAVIGPYTDRWGTWITALVPVIDTHTNTVVAVQGIDRSVDIFFAALGIKRLETIFAVWLFAIFTIAYYYYARRLREHLILRERSEKRYSAIVENAMDGIFIIQDGLIKYINSSAARILGTDMASSLNRPVVDFVHRDDHPVLLKKLADRMSGKQFDSFTPLRIVKPDGEVRYIETTGVLIDYEGRPADLAQVRDITERRLALTELRKANHRLEAIIDSLPDATFVIDHERKIIAWNRAMEEITGRSKSEMLGKGNYEYSLPLYGERRPAFIDVVFHDSGKKPLNYENIIREGDRAFAEAFVPGVLGGRGGYMWCTASLLRDENDEIIGAIETMRDISYRKELELELQASNEELKVWLRQSENRAKEVALIGEMVQWIDSCDTVDEATSIAGHYLQQLFKDDNGFLAFANTEKDVVETQVIFGKPEGDPYFSIKDCWSLRTGKLHTVDGRDTSRVCRHLGKDYHDPYIEVPLTAQGRPLGLLCIQYAPAIGHNSREIIRWLETGTETAARVAEPLSLALANTRLRATLREQANLDPLTGLYNRRYMKDAFERELHRATREQKCIGLIMADIDHFKLFNDKYGHEAGDIMLKTVAATIKSSIRAEDIACRFGGEEFLMILPSAGLEETEERASQIHRKIKKIEFDFNGYIINNVSISIGLAVFPAHGDNPLVLIGAADMALYAAKKQGRDRICRPVQ